MIKKRKNKDKKSFEKTTYAQFYLVKRVRINNTIAVLKKSVNNTPWYFFKKSMLIG